jgi:hypothetical protein
VRFGFTFALLLVALAGCTEPPPTAPRVEVAPVPVDPRAAGDAAARRGDWTGAVTHYRDALQRAPDDVMLHYALGSALSQLDRPDEAIEQFTWVVERGNPSQLEVSSARQWLQQANALTKAADRTTRDAAVARPREAAAPALAPGSGTISGRSSWPDVGGSAKWMSLHLRVKGDEEATSAVRRRLNVPIGAPFHLPKLPPGRYRLTGESGGTNLWDVPITIEAGKTTAVDLSPSNSLVPVGGFPPTG